MLNVKPGMHALLTLHVHRQNPNHHVDPQSSLEKLTLATSTPHRNADRHAVQQAVRCDRVH